MENPYINDKIDRFIKGKLSPEEEHAFHDEYTHNEAFGEEVNLRLLTQGAVYSYGVDHQKETFKNWFNEFEEEKPVRSLFSKPIMLSLAAALVILFGMAFLFTNIGSSPSTSSELFAAYYEIPRAPESLSATVTDIQALKTEARTHYFEGNFKQAATSYEELLTVDGMENPSEVHLYLGISYLESGEYDKAIASFKKADDNQEQAEWYTALTYLKADNKNAAKSALEQILKVPSHYYLSSATELLAKGNF